MQVLPPRKRSLLCCSFVVGTAVVIRFGAVQGFSRSAAPLSRTQSRPETLLRSTRTFDEAVTVVDDPRDVNYMRRYEDGYYYHDEESWRYDDDDEEEDLLDEYYSSRTMVSAVSGFFELQGSTGSEVLQADLQHQIDQSTRANEPNQFLDEHNEGDASTIEKVAMATIPEQLPRAAVGQLLSERTQTKTQQNMKRTSSKARKQHKGGNALPPRVTHEEELRLARLIQKGVAVQKIRTDLEDELGREATRQEWTQAAGLSSTKELRRICVYYRQAKHDLVSANMGLVHAVVNQQWYNQYQKTGISKEELVQEGSLGLLRAAELFDPERGLRFSTYAVVWIKGTLSNTHVTELVRLPDREKTKWNKIVKAQRELAATTSSSSSAVPGDGYSDPGATVQQLSAATGMKEKEVLAVREKMTSARSILSLDYEYDQQTRSGTDGGRMASLQNSDRAFMDDADLAERTQLRADVIAALANALTPREARLMRLRYGLTTDGKSRTLRECAEAMGISHTRVSQLSTRCLKKLRQADEVESLQEYLLTIA